MPQTLISAGGVANKSDVDKIVEVCEALDGVKMVNVNVDSGRIVVTHDASADIENVKTTISGLGYNVTS